MKLINKLLALLTFLFGSVLVALAAPPAYTGHGFDDVQTLTDDGSLYFGVVIALAVIITGFFLGRRWLRRV